MNIRMPAEDEEVIYRAWIRNSRTGKKIYARHHGKRAFRLVVKKRNTGL